MFRRLSLAIMLLLSGCSTAGAQDHPIYVGGALVLQTQPHSTTVPVQGSSEPLGGTTWGASGLFGVQLSRHVSFETEPSFGGTYSHEYTYASGPSRAATVIATRRDTFIPVQLRTRAAWVEPVAGLAFVSQHLGRRATELGQPYFVDDRTDLGFALTGGLDAPIKAGAHILIVPTFRMFVTSARSVDLQGTFDPLAEDTGTGRFVFRYGVGARFAF